MQLRAPQASASTLPAVKPRATAARDEVVLRYEDPDSRLAGVRLVAELYKREPPRTFRHANGGWELRLPHPDADRLEYLLELIGRNGTRELVTDPGAPSVPGPFGPRSEVLLPGYAPPAWTLATPPEGALVPLALPSRTLRTAVHGLLWSPPGSRAGEPLPLLVVHDGPEYAAYSGLARYLEVGTARGELPPLRAALLAPHRRDEDYSASARYALALGRELLPALAERAPAPPGRRHRAGLGASLGALALLHAHRRHPETFGALFLQSGSFFRRRHDALERGFSRFARVVRFVGSVRAATTWDDPIPSVLTCGAAEENLGSNRALAASLSAQGYDLELVETRDAHNWISWRDALHPHLTTLLRRAFA